MIFIHAFVVAVVVFVSMVLSNQQGRTAGQRRGIALAEQWEAINSKNEATVQSCLETNRRLLDQIDRPEKGNPIQFNQDSVPLADRREP